MKKFLSFCLVVSLIISSALVTFSLTASASDESSVITASDIDSFLDAVYDVSDGGTVKIDGDIVVPASSSPFIIGSDWEKKTFTITGGSLDFSGLTSGDGEKGFVILGENVVFDDIKLIFDSERNDYLFASGYQLTIKESVVFEGASVCLFGGSYLHGSYPNNKSDKIDITLLGGKYTTINGTSHGSAYSVPENVNIHIGGNATATTLIGNSGGCTVPGSISILIDGNATVNEVRGSGTGTVNGDVHVTIGGNANVKMTYGGGSSGTVKGNTYVIAKDNANSSCNASSHDMTYAIFGGGYGGTIEGSTNVLFTDNAKANYIWGGCKSGGEVLGGTNITMAGGTTMSMYGGGYGVAQNCDATVTLTGGTLEQVFGGCQSQAFTGDITIKLLGGTVKRRVFGGCYNEYKNTSTSFIPKYQWMSDYFVNGNIKLIIDSAVSVDFSYDEGGWTASISNDHALSAHSRRQSVSSSEIATVIFTDSAAKSAYNGNLKTGSVSGGKATDYTHCYQYSVTENVITQTCSEHSGYSATATVTLPADAIYNGSAYEASVSYSDNWEFGAFDVAHSDNINAGVASVKLTMLGAEIYSAEFTVSKATTASPSVSAKNETVKGKGDHDIIGVTTDMEYSLDGNEFIKISDTDMTWSVGAYYFRYAETDNYLASEPVCVEICEGEQLKVVFVVDGNEYEVKYLDWNETLEDIPAVPEKEGYTARWDKNEFVNVTADVVVNAVYELIPVIDPEPEETTVAPEDIPVIEETTVAPEDVPGVDPEETTVAPEVVPGVDPEETTVAPEDVPVIEETTVAFEETTTAEETTEEDAVENETNADTDEGETSIEKESDIEDITTTTEAVTDTEEATEAGTVGENSTETDKKEPSSDGCGGTVNGIAIILTTLVAIPVFSKKKRSGR